MPLRFRLRKADPVARRENGHLPRSGSGRAALPSHEGEHAMTDTATKTAHRPAWVDLSSADYNEFQVDGESVAGAVDVPPDAPESA